MGRWSGSPGLTGSQLYRAGVGCRKSEHAREPRLAVGAVVGQRLARPFAVIEQDGIHLGRGLVREPLAVQQGQQRGLLGRRQRAAVWCPRPGRCFARGRDGITLAV